MRWIALATVFCVLISHLAQACEFRDAPKDVRSFVDKWVSSHYSAATPAMLEDRVMPGIAEWLTSMDARSFVVHENRVTEEVLAIAKDASTKASLITQGRMLEVYDDRELPRYSELLSGGEATLADLWMSEKAARFFAAIEKDDCIAGDFYGHGLITRLLPLLQELDFALSDDVENML
ncbi:MAG: hypothetical protein AB8B85_23930 [Paracoccaceae bacterium]